MQSYSGSLIPTQKWVDHPDNKETVILNNTEDPVDLTGIYRTFYPTMKYTLFSSIHETFSRVNPMLSHKTSLRKLRKTEIMPSIFSDDAGIKLEISRKGNPENS